MAKFCTNCGNQLEDYYNVCPNCGTPSPKLEVNQGYYYQNYNVNNNISNTPIPMQENNIQYGWVVLGFFIPIAGWIMWGMWSNTKPETAKAAGIAGTIGFVINLIIYTSM